MFSKGVYTRYPFQGALYGLPPAVIKQCLLGAIEARYGSAKQHGGADPAASPSRLCQLMSDDHGFDVTDCCGDGVLEATAQMGVAASGNGHSEPRDFESFIYTVWGAGIAVDFNNPGDLPTDSRRQTYSLSSWDGISFWARGSTGRSDSLRFEVVTRAVASADERGTCARGVAVEQGEDILARRQWLERRHVSEIDAGLAQGQRAP